MLLQPYEAHADASLTVSQILQSCCFEWKDEGGGSSALFPRLFFFFFFQHFGALCATELESGELGDDKGVEVNSSALLIFFQLRPTFTMPRASVPLTRSTQQRFC